ncbi:MAG: TonB-dependent receptor [Melioribacteraceae bacterium]|nr:MAG: TonB-dependent receptor [Melioribacteraceae bacterium]
MKYSVFIFILLNFITLSAQNHTLSGKVISLESDEPLEGCNVIVSPGDIGTATDADGKFTLKMPAGEYKISISFLGYTEYVNKIALTNNLTLGEIKLTPSAIREDEVIVTAFSEEPGIVASELKSKDLKKMPNLYSDVMRSVKILPGVTSNNELSSGYNVRGGNFNENIVYLNGFEIYRPFLLRQGMEENQTIVNPDLVDDIKFYGGAFPVQYGGKMSSVLVVDYEETNDTNYSGNIRADLLNTGASLSRKFGDLSLAAGVRYAQPGLFLNELHTSGDYKPTFFDIQVLGNYKIDETSDIDLLLVNAENGFDLTPTEWLGHFKSDRGGDVNQVAINFDGYKNYSFNTSMAGVRYKKDFSEKYHLDSKISYYKTRESEDADYTGEYWYSPDAERPNDGIDFLKSSQDIVKNSLDLNSFLTSHELTYKTDKYKLLFGTEYKYELLTDKINEFYNEEGDEALLTIPSLKKRENDYEINSLALYNGINTKIFKIVNINGGLRYAYNSLTDEHTVSPRLLVTVTPNPLHTFKFGYGHYYQSPFFHELRSFTQGEMELISQKSVHYILGWEYRFKPDFTMQAELYYKDLPRIYSFYEEQFRTIYITDKFYEGYSTGFDLQFRGQLTEDLNSWIGYSFLDTKERELGSDEDYSRRLLDQTHTIQIFLQDKMPGHKNWQSHLRLLFGSGYLYNNRKLVSGENDQLYLKVEPASKGEILNYMRADMGLSAIFTLSGGSEILVKAEVLNVFNNYNVAGYEWVQAFKDIQYPVRIPQIYSKRFFNLGVEYSF